MKQLDAKDLVQNGQIENKIISLTGQMNLNVYICLYIVLSVRNSTLFSNMT